MFSSSMIFFPLSLKFIFKKGKLPLGIFSIGPYYRLYEVYYTFFSLFVKEISVQSCYYPLYSTIPLP